METLNIKRSQHDGLIEGKEGEGVVLEGGSAGNDRIKELAEHYASSDIFLFPSLTETFGNVTLEALAAGLVVVAFDVAAASVHITHATSGFVAEPGNDTQFVVLARRAVADLHRLTPMRQAARRAGLAASWDSILSGFEDVLLSVGAARQGLRAAYAD
jgi:glycosyltransferase involved in cell wall biosynthesis